MFLRLQKEISESGLLSQYLVNKCYSISVILVAKKDILREWYYFSKAIQPCILIATSSLIDIKE